jgi:hypothetical protein
LEYIDFGQGVADRDEKIFVPPTGFETGAEAIAATRLVSFKLAELHNKFGLSVKPIDTIQGTSGSPTASG